MTVESGADGDGGLRLLVGDADGADDGLGEADATGVGGIEALGFGDGAAASATGTAEHAAMTATTRRRQRIISNPPPPISERQFAERVPQALYRSPFRPTTSFTRPGV